MLTIGVTVGDGDGVGVGVGVGVGCGDGPDMANTEAPRRRPKTVEVGLIW